MHPSVSSAIEQVAAISVRVNNDVLHVSLADGREISVPLARVEWLQWLRRATPEQQARWSLEPGGYAIYWDELDDGVEVGHLPLIEHTSACVNPDRTGLRLSR